MALTPREALLGALVALFGVVASLGGTGLWLLQRVEQRRLLRLAELQEELPGLRALDQPDADQACALLEHHLLSRGDSGALAVDCTAAKLDETGEGVLRLAGTVHATSWDNALFGGGFGTPHCLARTTEGWTVLGRAWDLDECAFDAGDLGEGAEAVATAERLAQARQRALAEASVARVQALTSVRVDPPERCEGLAPASGRAVGFVDADLLRLEPGTPTWRSLSSPAFAGCLEGADPDRFGGGCGLREPWRVVLVLHRGLDEPPALVSDDQFIGGEFAGTLQLVDLEAGDVACARVVTADLAGTVVLAQGDWIVNHYNQRVRAEICRAVEEMTAGAVSMDPFWGCD
jgi:hypothetical protein